MKPTTATVNSLSTKNRIREGVGQYGISATRYDFLRIAKAIMDDWQNDTSAARKWKNASSFESLWIVEAK
jgi:hypothetical protein